MAETKATPEDQQARIAAIRERLKGVDPEGWGFYVEDERPDKDCDYRVYRNDGAWGVCKPTHSSQHQRKADAEFIAAAPSDITFLLDALASAPATAPSPCEWAVVDDDSLGGFLKPGCRASGGFHARTAQKFTVCPYCGHPLTLAEVPHV
jgi:hypothetical protein